MKKTAREWFNTLPVDVCERAIRNCPEPFLDNIFRECNHAISSCFCWDSTPEGHDYWEKIVYGKEVKEDL
jgi:hypothetical protein